MPNFSAPKVCCSGFLVAFDLHYVCECELFPKFVNPFSFSPLCHGHEPISLLDMSSVVAVCCLPSCPIKLVFNFCKFLNCTGLADRHCSFILLDLACFIFFAPKIFTHISIFVLLFKLSVSK